MLMSMIPILRLHFLIFCGLKEEIFEEIFIRFWNISFLLRMEVGLLIDFIRYRGNER